MARALKDNGYRPVDDKPYGGGPGMVMKAEPLLSAVAKAMADKKAKKGTIKIILFSPSGKSSTQLMRKSW